MQLGPAVIDDITFDELGDALLMAIDDGKWAEAKVTVLKPAPKKRTAEAATRGTSVDGCKAPDAPRLAM